MPQPMTPEDDRRTTATRPWIARRLMPRSERRPGPSHARARAARRRPGSGRQHAASQSTTISSPAPAPARITARISSARCTPPVGATMSSMNRAHAAEATVLDADRVAAYCSTQRCLMPRPICEHQNPRTRSAAPTAISLGPKDRSEPTRRADPTRHSPMPAMAPPSWIRCRRVSGRVEQAFHAAGRRSTSAGRSRAPACARAGILQMGEMAAEQVGNLPARSGKRSRGILGVQPATMASSQSGTSLFTSASAEARRRSRGAGPRAFRRRGRGAGRWPSCRSRCRG